jgi:DNA (cytosine-5)-methyltransferase 1
MRIRKYRELVIDSFAGGGGASLGIAWALGRSPDIAINHCPAAIAMHEANHPSTKHVREDVWKTDLRKLVGGRPVGLLHASPDCRHFSRAKGGKPVSKSVRSLAWIICKWAEQVRPRIITMENVREFQEWSPIVPRWVCGDCGWKGTEGQATLVRTRRKCPRCESRSLRKTDDMIPDPARKGLTFKRWLGRLRNLGYAVQHRVLDAADFGAPTHRKRLFVVARRDGQAIQWPEPTHGPPDKLNAMPLFGRLKPYRTAAECIDFSIPCPSIFDRKKPLKEKTLRRIAEGIKRYVLEAAEPFILPTTHAGERRSHPTDEPFPTVTGANRGEFALVAPTLMQYYGKKSEGDVRTTSMEDPVPVIPTENRHALVSAFLARHNFEQTGQSIDAPAPTLVSRGTQTQLVAANLVHMNHGEKQWSDLREPLRTITTGGQAALVYSFMIRYFGQSIGQYVTEPLFTITGKDRFGLVLVHVAGEPYAIVDIGLRMLSPRELANAQGFPSTYVLTGTKTSQVARLGNSVCPQVAAALVRENLASGAASVRPAKTRRRARSAAL